MASEREMSWFVPFYTHDPSENPKCIYYARTKDARCRVACEDADNQRAVELHNIINNLPAEDVDIQLIEEYILYNCCRRYGRHRDRIEDVGRLTPWAERWLEEIEKHAAEQSTRAVSAAPPEADITLLGDVPVPTTPSNGHTIQAYTTPAASTTPATYCGTPGYTMPVAYPTPPVCTPPPADTTPDCQYHTPTRNNVNTAPPTPVASASNSQLTLSRSSPISPEIPPTLSESQPRYDLRDREAQIPTDTTLVRAGTFPRPTQSEFRAHIAQPDPTECVSSKIQDKLRDRDFETGSLYIFDRTSSPGHVKIGWTARSVSGRLESWSECGYKPNLLFQVDRIPHAQRVETLTHYELIKEWRRERVCKGKDCGKQHQEWFEVSKERAEQILGDWARFMKVAEPYDSNGFLKIEWSDFVKKTAENRETLTVTRLLEHYELSLAEDTTLVEESAGPEPEPKIEEQEEGVSNAPKLENIEDPKEAVAQLDSLRIELRISSEDVQLFKNEASPEPLTSITPPQLKEQPKVDQVKPLQEDIAAAKALADKESLPEQIQRSSPSPVSPPLQSVALDDDGEVKPVSDRNDSPIHESVIQAEAADESAVTEIKPGIENDQWDNEETLVEIASPASLKEVALKIVEELCPKASVGKSNGLEVLETEVTPAVQVAAQA